MSQIQSTLFNDPHPELNSNAIWAEPVLQQPAWPDRFGSLLRAWSTEFIPRPIKTLSLFSGAGGLDIGFHDAGFNIVTMLEIDRRFVSTLQANCGADHYFPSTEVICDDIRNFVPLKDAHIDFIIGGPPCQPFSAAGRRAAGVEGTSVLEGNLFKEYVRLVKELSPQGFLFENVYGITGAEGGQAWKQIQEAFRDAGYFLAHRILDAADYGVPQHRERLFIIGSTEKECLFPRPTHGPDSYTGLPFFNAGKAINGVILSPEEAHAFVGGRYGYLLEEIPPGLNFSFFTEKMGHPNPIFAWRSKFSDFLYKAAPDTPVRTIKAQGGQYTGPFHWSNRPFSVNELKRLQTFPDSYKISGTKLTAIQQIGNSVPPQVARMLAISILKEVFGKKIPLKLSFLRPNERLSFRKRKGLLTKIYKRKAEEALKDHITPKKNRNIRSHTYWATLSEDFGWKLSHRSSKSLFVEFNPDTPKWLFAVSKATQIESSAFSIYVTASHTDPWSLHAQRVELHGSDLCAEIFIGVWKAFEWEIMQTGFKADLVQLCGYYQYPRAFSCSMSFSVPEEVTETWRVVQAVVTGVGVRQILPEWELAKLWEVDQELVLSHALNLKALGYEVRNDRTNPQIPTNHFLIPYSFPTLCPMSVQRRKSLEGLHETTTNAKRRC